MRMLKLCCQVAPTEFSQGKGLVDYHNRTVEAGVWSVLMVLGVLMPGMGSAIAQELQLPDNQRWLEVQQMQGQVQYRSGSERRPARVGDRLQRSRQGIDTAARSSSVLELDTDIGVVRVAENTSLQVGGLMLLGDGGRITSLRVDRGQARLQIRRFTHPSSGLEVETPAGVAAVRGTLFGVSVDPVGKTGVATLAGLVEASAQGVTVAIEPGFVSTIVPGEPPSEPRPLDRVLDVETTTLWQTSGFILVRGQLDSANQLTINGQDVVVEEGGRFQARITASPFDRQLTLTVRNPVGEERTHGVWVP